MIVLIVAISSAYSLETLALSYFVIFISSSIVFNIEPQYVGMYDKENIFYLFLGLVRLYARSLLTLIIVRAVTRKAALSDVQDTKTPFNIVVSSLTLWMAPASHSADLLCSSAYAS